MEEPKYSIVEMKTFDPVSQKFMFEFDRKLWKLEEWDVEKAPNRLAVVHRNYEEKNCFILPGTIGLGKDEVSQIIEGSFLTSRYVGRTLTITHPAGYVLKEVVGYEVEEIPYIFELNLPVGGADTCKQDAQFVMASFDMVKEEDSTPEKPTSPREMSP